MAKFRNYVSAKLTQLDFPENQFNKTEHPKKTIYWHFTGSGKGVDGDYKHWLNTKARIATSVIINYDGTISQLFSSKYWAYHLGVKSNIFEKFNLPNINKLLNQQSIGVEIDTWGYLFKKGSKYYSWTGTEVPSSEVVTFSEPYGKYPSSNFFNTCGASNKPCKYYHRISKQQIETCRELALFWNDKYGIPLTFDYNNLFTTNENALKGVPGMYTHHSCRPDKFDIAPQPDFVEMLKGLER